MKANWYGLYTKINSEKKVVELLYRRNIENYYPTRVVTIKGNFGRKKMEQPLFPSYVFIRVEEARLDSIKKFPGVINLLFWLEQPVIIQDSEIEIMKIISSENPDIQIQKSKINYKKINDGPKIYSIEIDGIKTFKVTLRSIGYNMITQIESPKLTIISSIPNNYLTSPEANLIT